MLNKKTVRLILMNCWRLGSFMWPSALYNNGDHF